MYYLNARYYNPVLCRFISPDTILGGNRELLSYNLYAYCSNNPVIRYDPTGNYEDVFAIDPIRDSLYKTPGGGYWGLGANPIIGVAGNYHNSGGEFVSGGFGAAIIPVQSVTTKPEKIGEAIIAGMLSIITIAKSVAKTKELPDVKIKRHSNSSYQLAYINDSGELIKLYGKMSFELAYSVLAMQKSNSIIYNCFFISRNYLQTYYNKTWGVYTHYQSDAKYLAVALGFTECPKVHGNGYYGHYHNLDHSIHIWFGGKISY